MPILTLPNSMTRRPRNPAWSLALTGLLPLALACDGEQLKPAPLAQPADLYWDLNLNHHAVMLSTTPPYDTLTLTATPRNYQGEPLAGLPTPRYRSTQPNVVQVTPEGVMVAIEASSNTPVQVVATVTVGNITHEDSLVVRVSDNPNPPVLTTFSIHPVPPDSAKVAAEAATILGGFRLPYTPRLRALDANGNAIPDLPISLRSADTTVAAVVAGAVPTVRGLRPGNTTLYAGVTAYGVSKVDTLPFVVGYPLINAVGILPVEAGSPVNKLAPTEVRIGVGGMVAFVLVSPTVTTETDITFTDPASAAPLSLATFSEYTPVFCGLMFVSAGLDCTVGGDFVLPPVSPDYGLSFGVRTFQAPGTYEFHSTAGGYNGRVIVLDDR